MGHIKPKHRRRGWAEKIIISDPAYAVLSQINSSHHLRARRGGGSRKMTWWQGGGGGSGYPPKLMTSFMNSPLFLMLFLVNEINFNSLHLQWIGVDRFPFGSPFPLFQWHPITLHSLDFCGVLFFFVTFCPVGYSCGLDEFRTHLKSSKSWSKLIDCQWDWLKV